MACYILWWFSAESLLETFSESDCFSSETRCCLVDSVDMGRLLGFSGESRRCLADSVDVDHLDSPGRLASLGEEGRCLESELRL